MYKEGLFTKYDSPSAKDFTKESIDPNLGPRYRNVVIGVVYNKDVLKPADAPKTLEDLAKPQYRGKIVMKRSPRTRAPGSLLALPTRAWRTPATTSTLRSRIS